MDISFDYCGLPTFLCPDELLRNENGAVVVYTDGSTFRQVQAAPVEESSTDSLDNHVTNQSAEVNYFEAGSAIVFNRENVIIFKPEINTSVYAEYAAIEKAIQIGIERKIEHLEIRTDCL